MVEAIAVPKLLYDTDFNGILRWRIQVGCRGTVDCIAGYTHESRNEFRWTVQIEGRKYLRSHLVFAIYKLRWPTKGLVLDHIDRNTLNDSITNLREVTQKVNMENRPVWGWYA